MNKLSSQMSMSYLLLFIFSVFACEKENPEPEYFTPTDHFICIMESKMVLSVEVPQLGEWYNFYSNKDLIYEDSHLYPEQIGLCKNYQVSPADMEKLAQFLSDTILFKWHRNLYFPDEHSCLSLDIYDSKIGLRLSIDCSFGNDSSTIVVLKELSKALKGEAAEAFNEIIGVYEDELEKSNQPDTIITSMNIREMAGRHFPDFVFGSRDSIHGKYNFYNGSENVSLDLEVRIYNSVEQARMRLAAYLLDYGTVTMEQGPSDEFSIGYKYWVRPYSEGKLAYLVFTRKNVVFIFNSRQDFEFMNPAKLIDDDIINREDYITFGIESP
ncbi:MAG: hypothetical protein U0T82_10945 [Bacteroidales bacterium]